MAGRHAVAARLGSDLAQLVRLLERTGPLREGLDRPAYLLLARLVEGGSQRLTALADAVHSDPSTVSRQVAHLVELGLVRRGADPADGRASVLAATDEGIALLEKTKRCRLEHLVAILSGWSVSDQERFAELLTRFRTDFDAYRARHVPQHPDPPPAPDPTSDTTASDPAAPISARPIGNVDGDG